MKELKDIKLKSLLNEMKLESPGSNFSVQVMNRIFKEDSVLERIKSEQILGKGFWIITILFFALMVTVFLISNIGIDAQSQLPEIMPELRNNISTGYQLFFAKLGSMPLSIAGILIATSVLLFIDRFINSNIKVFS